MGDVKRCLTCGHFHAHGFCTDAPGFGFVAFVGSEVFDEAPTMDGHFSRPPRVGMDVDTPDGARPILSILKFTATPTLYMQLGAPACADSPTPPAAA